MEQVAFLLYFPVMVSCLGLTFPSLQIGQVFHATSLNLTSATILDMLRPIRGPWIMIDGFLSRESNSFIILV